MARVADLGNQCHGFEPRSRRKFYFLGVNICSDSNTSVFRIETLNRGPVREHMHNDLARTLNPIPSFGREGRCVERRPMVMDDTKMHSLDHFSVVEKKNILASV